MSQGEGERKKRERFTRTREKGHCSQVYGGLQRLGKRRPRDKHSGRIEVVVRKLVHARKRTSMPILWWGVAVSGNAAWHGQPTVGRGSAAKKNQSRRLGRRGGLLKQPLAENGESKKGLQYTKHQIEKYPSAKKTVF